MSTKTNTQKNIRENSVRNAVMSTTKVDATTLSKNILKNISFQSMPCADCGECYSLATILKTPFLLCGRCLNAHREMMDFIVYDNDEKDEDNYFDEKDNKNYNTNYEEDNYFEQRDFDEKHNGDDSDDSDDSFDDFFDNEIVTAFPDEVYNDVDIVIRKKTEKTSVHHPIKRKVSWLDEKEDENEVYNDFIEEEENNRTCFSSETSLNLLGPVVEVIRGWINDDDIPVWMVIRKHGEKKYQLCETYETLSEESVFLQYMC